MPSRARVAAVAAVIVLGLAAAAIYEGISFVGGRGELDAAARRAAAAAAVSPEDPQAAARRSVDTDLPGRDAKVAVESGRLPPGGAAIAFVPAEGQAEAYRVSVTSAIPLPIAGLFGVEPFPAVSTAVVRRYPLAALGLEDGDSRRPVGPVAAAALAAAYRTDLRLDEPAMAVLRAADIPVLGLIGALRSADAGPSDGRSEAAGLLAADVLKAAASTLGNQHLRARQILLDLAAALPDDLPRLPAETVFVISGFSGNERVAEDLSLFALPAAQLVTGLGRALVLAAPVRFILDRPADSIAEVAFELRAPDAAPIPPPLAAGPVGLSAALPDLVLSGRASLFGAALPRVIRIDLPFRLTLSGGTLDLRGIGCLDADPVARTVDLELRPLRADVTIAPFPAEGAAVPASAADEPIPLIEDERYRVWISGEAVAPPDNPTLATVAAPEFGSRRTVRSPVDVTAQVDRAVAGSRIIVSTEDPRLPAAAVRDEVQRTLAAATADLGAVLDGVLSGYGLASGALGATVAGVSCNGFEFVE